ncbi:MAG: hypothetical protein JW862_13105 [Anaerolineales bacterium]|nr:hypothetical protein [Anaerolineales bacterium]
MEFDTQVLLKIVFLAALLEAVVQTLKPIWEPEKRSVDFYVTLAVGLVISVGANYLADLDLFAAVGVPLVKAAWVGVILTGILVSRGANVLHDIFKLLQGLKEMVAGIFIK